MKQNNFNIYRFIKGIMSDETSEEERKKRKRSDLFFQITEHWENETDINFDLSCEDMLILLEEAPYYLACRADYIGKKNMIRTGVQAARAQGVHRLL